MGEKERRGWNLVREVRPCKGQKTEAWEVFLQNDSKHKSHCLWHFLKA